MSLVSFSNISDGTGIDAADVNNPLNTIYDDYNGNIDNSNIAAAAAIAGTKLADSAITTAKIAASAVTTAKLATGSTSLGWAEAAGGSTLTTSYADQVSVTATSTGKTVRIKYSGFYQNGNSGAARTFDIRLYLDGTTSVKTITANNLANISGATFGYYFSYTFSHTPSAASHTWAVQALASANSAVVASQHSMEVVEVS